MPSHTFYLIAILTLSTATMAMPSWDGHYTCSGGTLEGLNRVSFETHDNSLFLSGEVNVEQFGIPASGLPCKNTTVNMMSISIVTVCNANHLSQKTTLSLPVERTKTETGIAVNQMDTHVTIVVSVVGDMNGFPVNHSQTIRCTKN